MRTKFLATIVIVFGIFFHGYSQTDLPYHYELKGEEYDVADSLLRYWMNEKYPDILYKNKIRMTCATCDAAYMDVTMNIDEEGSWYGVNVLKSNICDKEISYDLKVDFIWYFATIKFPLVLRGKKFIYRLGTSLKC